LVKRICVILLLGIFSLSIGGCASRQEIMKLKLQADYLEQSNQRIEANVAQLDSLAKEQLRQIQKLKADMNSSFGEMDERFNVVENKIEDSKNTFYQPSIKKETEASVDSDRKEEKPDSSKELAINLDPEKLYKSAYLDLTKGNYDLAISGFHDYLKYFPDEESAANAQYWIGESYYSKGDFTRAAIELRKVLSDYPKSEKTAGALYKLGLCYSQLKEDKTAKQYFDKLIKNYPQSQEAKLARERLKKH